MTFASIAVLAALLAQTPTAESNETQRAALAAERAALAAERTAQAVERIADTLQAAPAEAPPKEAPAAPSAAEWAGSLGLSLISLTGNAESLTGAINLAAERKSPNWIWSAKAFGTYGQSRPADGGPIEVVALAGGVSARGDRRLTRHTSVFAGTGIETDHVKSIEYRYIAEGGASIVWLERKETDYTRLLLRTDLGLRYALESRFQYFPVALDVEDITLIAPRLGISFRYLLDKNVGFFQDVEVLTNVAGDARVLVNSQSKLSARLSKALALGLSFEVRYDSTPAPGKKPTDTALTATLEVGF